MTNTPLNPDGVLNAMDTLMAETDADERATEWAHKVTTRVLEGYFAVAQPVVTGERVNRAGWTCDGIHEPGSYATCEDCRGACDDLANFYNQMRSTPDASGPWAYRPEVPGA